jgi:hypothetical protein
MVMAGLTVATGLLTAVLWGGRTIEKASAAALQQLQTQQVLADQFRTDVAQAADVAQRWNEEVAGPTCLILRLGKDRVVLYRWEAGRMVRSEFVGEKVQRRAIPVGGGPSAAEFVRSGPGNRLVTLRLLTLRKDGRKEPTVDITAALGGDLQ